MIELSGKKAIVTGGAMGIGLATCKRLLKEQCDVTIWDMNEAALEDAKKALEGLGGRVFTHVCDVTDKERVRALVRTAREEMGQIDILVNNAGYVRSGGFCSRPVEDWERMTAVNLTSMYYTIHEILPEMYDRNSGHIINISSAAALLGVTDLAVYAATKWAVWGLTESLKQENIRDKKNIRFTSIHPMFLKQGMFEGGKLNILGDLLIPRIKDHDAVAADIVEKALKKNQSIVRRPWTLYLIILIRALLPDMLFVHFMRVFGIGHSMKHWVGRPGSEHAQK